MSQELLKISQKANGMSTPKHLFLRLLNKKLSLILKAYRLKEYQSKKIL
jgi:hypothetical protein